MNFSDILFYSHHRSSEPPRRSPDIEELYRTVRNTTNYELDLYHEIFPHADVEWTLTLNKYPYHFTDDTLHYIIWYRWNVRYDDLKDILDEIGAVHFENEQSEKSISTIDHIHVFLKST